MAKKKSDRNKTISTGIREGQKYLDRCVSLTRSPASVEEYVNKTIHGDCLDVCRLLPRGSVDLIIADPPYNISKTFGERSFSRKSTEQYEEYTREWLGAVIPLLKPNGSIYVCCDWESSLVIGRVMAEMLTVRNRITWQREKGRGARANWKNGMEDIWFATVGEEYTFNLESVKQRRRVLAPYKVDGEARDWEEVGEGKYRDTCPSNFWDDITIPFWSMAENTSHPTQKPEKLLAKLILASSCEGDTVLDPFLGSGTTSVVAKKLGRKYIGIERESQYCIWAEERLEMAEKCAEIQGYSGGVFWERNSTPKK